MCAWWDVPLRSVLDVGAGTGLWRDWFASQRPRVVYRSIDISDYVCRQYGHEQANIATWRPSEQADLVVCQGVLQYLDDEACSRAIGNLALACGAVLYLEVPTMADRYNVIDVDATDLDVHWRTGTWYRRRLGRHFTVIGGGLFAARCWGFTSTSWRPSCWSSGDGGEMSVGEHAVRTQVAALEHHGGGAIAQVEDHHLGVGEQHERGHGTVGTVDLENVTVLH